MKGVDRWIPCSLTVNQFPVAGHVTCIPGCIGALRTVQRWTIGMFQFKMTGELTLPFARKITSLTENRFVSTVLKLVTLQITEKSRNKITTGVGTQETFNLASHVRTLCVLL